MQNLGGYTLIIANTLFQQHKRKLYTGTSQMVNTEIRLIIFFEAKDGEALYSQQKQDWELTVAQILLILSILLIAKFRLKF